MTPKKLPNPTLKVKRRKNDPLTHKEKMLVNNAIVSFDLIMEDKREFVQCGVDFHSMVGKKTKRFFDANDDDFCLIRRAELIDFARRCLRESLRLATSSKRPF